MDCKFWDHLQIPPKPAGKGMKYRSCHIDFDSTSIVQQALVPWPAIGPKRQVQ